MLRGCWGEHGEGRVVAHGPQRLLPAHGHGVEKEVHRLGGVPEHVEVPVALLWGGGKGEGGVTMRSLLD